MFAEVTFGPVRFISMRITCVAMKRHKAIPDALIKDISANKRKIMFIWKVMKYGLDIAAFVDAELNFFVIA